MWEISATQLKRNLKRGTRPSSKCANKLRRREDTVPKLEVIEKGQIEQSKKISIRHCMDIWGNDIYRRGLALRRLI